MHQIAAQALTLCAKIAGATRRGLLEAPASTALPLAV